MCNTKQYICLCEDSEGIPHNIPISKEEWDQDGMYRTCADQVWLELTHNTIYIWKHKTAVSSDG